MPKFVRPREGTGMLVHPETGAVASPDPSRPVRSDDPLVKAFPWAFVSDEELAAEIEQRDGAWRESAIESARRADQAIAEREKVAKDADAEGVKLAEERSVEAATSRPGEKRSTRR